MYASKFFFGLSVLFTTVIAHGNVVSPPVRLPGPAMARACGSNAAAAVQADATGPIENIPNTGTCNLFLCKGARFEDNVNNVQNFVGGQVVNFAVELPIPHEGPANVSIVDTRTNQVIGFPLIEFSSYADEKLPALPPNNTAFSVTMPTDLGAQCSIAGTCVLQWFWFGTSARQTYEDCVDFVAV